MKILRYKIDHPDFLYATKGHHESDQIVFIFQRREWIEPTPEQLDKYAHDSAIVKKHGGVMIKREFEIAGPAPRYLPVDILTIRALIRKKYPKLRIHRHWNGVLLYTLSVSCQRITAKKKRI